MPIKVGETVQRRPGLARPSSETALLRLSQAEFGHRRFKRREFLVQPFPELRGALVFEQPLMLIGILAQLLALCRLAHDFLPICRLRGRDALGWFDRQRHRCAACQQVA